MNPFNLFPSGELFNSFETKIIFIIKRSSVKNIFYLSKGNRSREPENKKEWFTGTIYRIVQPDSIQAKKIKPVTEWVSNQIDSLEASSNRGLANVLDSVRNNSSLSLPKEQFKRLDEFDNRAKGHWRGRGHH